MRSICVIYIVGFWHLVEYMSIEIQKLTFNSFTYQTTYCVLATFTLLSGFFAAHNSIKNSKDIILYYKKKILRLYPLFILACILFVICGYNSWSSLPIYLIGLGEIIPPFPVTLWFMCMIFMFYFLTPFLIRIINPHKKFFFFLIVEVIFLGAHIMFGIDIRLTYYWVFYYLGLIIKFNNWHLKFNKKIILTTICFFIYIILSLSLGEEFVFLTFFCASTFVYSVSSILFFLFSRRKSNKLITTVSYASMCAYLFHRPIYYTLKYWGGVFSVPESYFICLPLVFLISWLIQFGYDRLVLCFVKK